MTGRIACTGLTHDKGDPDYVRLIGRRSNAESGNQTIDDDLYLRRAVSLGTQGQLFDLLCHAFVQNSVARYRTGHQVDHRPPSRRRPNRVRTG